MDHSLAAMLKRTATLAGRDNVAGRFAEGGDHAYIISVESQRGIVGSKVDLHLLTYVLRRPMILSQRHESIKLFRWSRKLFF